MRFKENFLKRKKKKYLETFERGKKFAEKQGKRDFRM
jgi:hypothetical protein